MDHLVEGGAITVDMMDAVAAEKGRREQARAFLMRFRNCGHRAFGCFINSLEKTQPFIAEKLKATLKEMESRGGDASLCMIVSIAHSLFLFSSSIYSLCLLIRSAIVIAVVMGFFCAVKQVQQQ